MNTVSAFPSAPIFSPMSSEVMSIDEKLNDTTFLKPSHGNDCPPLQSASPFVCISTKKLTLLKSSSSHMFVTVMFSHCGFSFGGAVMLYNVMM